MAWHGEHVVSRPEVTCGVRLKGDDPLMVLIAASASPNFTDWIGAGAAVLAAGSTVFLVIFAARQIKAAREQAEIAREASARQWYPLVYAYHGESPGPDPDLLSDEHIGCFYYLRNEGLGPALNIEHGVEVRGTSWPFGGDQARQFRSVQLGTSIPPVDDDDDGREPGQCIVKHIPEAEFYADEEVPEEIVYWCRFESLFGDRWETRNSNDPTQPPEIRRLASAQRD